MPKLKHKPKDLKVAKSSVIIQKGFRYSLLYCAQPEDQSDSIKFRRRLGMILDSVQGEDVEEFSLRWERATGIPRFVDGQPERDDRWMYDLERVELPVVLDSITIAFDHINSGPSGTKQQRIKLFIAEVRRVFSEERILYTIDNTGGVHPKVDATFVALRSAAISGMRSPRYETANIHIEKIDEALMKEPPDGTAAIRSAFDAAENIFKMMFRKPRKLAERELSDTLREWVRKEYQDDYPTDVVAIKNYENFLKWIEAAHFYRHQRGHPKPHQPPYDLAILMISQGLGFIRWLVDIDQRTLSAQSDAGKISKQ